MRSEKTERVKIWLELLKNDIYKPVGEVKLHRMTTYENLGFKAVHTLIKKQSAAAGWASKKQENDPTAKVFYAEYPAAWGRKWEYGWFYGKTDFSGMDIPLGSRVELMPDVGGEMLIEVNGVLAGSRDLKHDGVTLTQCFSGEAEYEILIESYAGHGPRLENAGPLPYGKEAVPEPPHDQVRTGKCMIAVCNEEAYGLYIDVLALWQLYQTLDKRSLRAEKILDALFEFTRIADFEAEPAERKKSFIEARDVLKDVLMCENGDTAPDFAIFGQSHLDLAWKWTVEETRRKCARTYSTQLALMDEYPEYVFFGCSPYIFESVRKDYPELFARIAAKVKAGQLVADGGMYVESDTNIPEGEALIRQILYAKEWYRQYFGTDTVMVWLPDCFGFSGQLPQIMKKSGIEYFSTQKLFRAREGAEPFPYNDFIWEGIDGTRIVSHMHKKNNARLEVGQIIERWEKDRVQDENFSEMMFPFGYGDGGGGATRDMLETAERVSDLEGCPRTHYEDPVSFMKRLDVRLAAQAEKSGYGNGGVNLWRGELYLPWHRGTYTSQAGIKFANRKTEQALREADMWCSIAAFKGLADEKEMRNSLKALWVRMMFLQFHDILPGTSIEQVNKEALEEFGKVCNEAGILALKAKRLICGADGTVWNTVPAERPLGRDMLTVPSCGYLVVKTAGEETAEEDTELLPDCFMLEDGSVVMSNGLITVTVDRFGRMISCIAGEHEFIAAPANEFKLYRDVNVEYDAWEIATFYRREELKDAFANSRIVDYGTQKKETGSEAYIEIAAEFSGSVLYQRISLAKDGRQVEFTTGIDWRETHKLLRVEFPTTINTDSVISEIQYGYVKRPNHRSRRSDADCFEGSMHRYAALAEDNCGVILLNDGKYGCSAEGGNIGITCLKAAKFPDGHADMGKHYFSYAFRPYFGSFAHADAAVEGLKFNAPLETASVPDKGRLVAAASESFFSVSAENVVLDWVKPAEDGSGDLIIRLYESVNAHEHVILNTTLAAAGAVLCNMIEQPLAEVEATEDKDGGMSIELGFKPFEVKTLRLVRKKR